MLTGHGNDIYDYAGRIRGDFSSNIPYRNASPTIAEYLRSRLHLIGEYPDPLARKLTSQIATHHGISPGNVLVTNGSAEAFYLLAHLFRGKHSMIAYPAFSEYEDACRVYGHTLSFQPVRVFRENPTFASDLVWFAVPNNPDGTIVDNETIDCFCRNHPHTFFIIDAAYGELCPRCEPLTPLHALHANLISVHSLTKTFGIPGLRLGYVIAREEVIGPLRELSTPWSVNAPALEAGSYVMENYRALLPDSAALCRESAAFQEQLNTLPQLRIIDSPCHFFLACLKRGTAAELKAFLVAHYGLLIRDASNFRGLSPQHFRLSVQDKRRNDELINGLKKFSER
jgi:Histidinol-phosphate/aromatic aminotransferase and cobyric acid decarboxylase